MSLWKSASFFFAIVPDSAQNSTGLPISLAVSDSTPQKRFERAESLARVWASSAITRVGEMPRITSSPSMFDKAV